MSSKIIISTQSFNYYYCCPCPYKKMYVYTLGTMIKKSIQPVKHIGHIYINIYYIELRAVFLYCPVFSFKHFFELKSCLFSTKY